jgi:hypothetical protein
MPSSTPPDDATKGASITMTILARRMAQLSLLVGLLPVVAACEAPRPAARPAPGPAAASGPSDPAPLPSDVTDDYLAQRRAGTTARPTGPDAMPGFDPAQRMGSDMTTAPIPSGGPRLLPR